MTQDEKLSQSFLALLIYFCMICQEFSKHSVFWCSEMSYLMVYHAASTACSFGSFKQLVYINAIMLFIAIIPDGNFKECQINSAAQENTSKFETGKVLQSKLSKYKVPQHS